MKILHISDTHGRHRELELKEADVLCFTGDESNYRDPYKNHGEFSDFFNWMEDIRYLYKRVLFVPGNHCYIEGTRYLTKEGWKRYEDISDKDLIATFDKSGQIYFENYIKRCEGVS